MGRAEIDELRRVLGDPRVLGDHECHGLSDVAYDVAGDQGLQDAGCFQGGGEGEPDRDPHVRHIGGGEDCDDAGEGERG